MFISVFIIFSLFCYYVIISVILQLCTRVIPSKLYGFFFLILCVSYFFLYNLMCNTSTYILYDANILYDTNIQTCKHTNNIFCNKKDISLPLDSESLRDAEVVYLTDRLITMSHPAMQSPKNGDITPNRKLAAISHLLQKRHGGKFMIWNLSELEYDYSLLNDQVMTFNFPGSPSPPLGLMLKILLSIESWLKADGENVAVVHCLTGLGRTSTVFAMFLCWMGEAGFDDHDPNKALEYIANCKRISPEKLTIPSQRRYVSYFKNMMDSVRPSQPPILLKRIIMSEAPKVRKYCVYLSLVVVFQKVKFFVV